MRRALALAAAIAMVVLAVVVRSAIDDDGGGDGRAVTVVCPADLADACRALHGDVTVRVQDPAATLAAIEAGELADDVDGWFTTNAWVEVLASRVPDAVARTQPAAVTRPVVLADPDRGSAIEGLCKDDPVWRCLGDHAGEAWSQLGGDARWGAVRTGVPDADSATGLGVLATVAAGYFGDADFATNDFDDGSFASWLSTLAGTSTGDPDPLGTLVTRRGTYSAAGGTEARTSTIGQATRPVAVTPAIPIQAVLVGFSGRHSLPGVAPARDALAGAGWTPMADGDQLLPVLKPGVLAALHSLWTEVVR
jgi:hypothetical protein